ncbi:hypothetical protein Ctaglu_34940 [Clostridium tagluense]|uniref:Uncharacterized protein n=1 Tax=Clostridium tagluense TaxID=360422 RepID=A0A401UQS9_9CLOT|nr:hypothetical protein Ctaglu_34940 [Clostridium tagluense]
MLALVNHHLLCFNFFNKKIFHQGLILGGIFYYATSTVLLSVVTILASFLPTKLPLADAKMFFAMTKSISAFTCAYVTVGTPFSSALMSSTDKVKYLPSIDVKNLITNLCISLFLL